MRPRPSKLNWSTIASQTGASGEGLESRIARGGFTFIELILVLFFLGMMMVGFAGVLGGGTGADIVAEADMLRGNIGFVQALAMANNTVTWSIYFNGSSYYLRSNSVPSTVKFPGETSATRAFPSGIRLITGFGSLTFDQWGAPAIQKVVTLFDGTRTEQVTINAFTGMVE